MCLALPRQGLIRICLTEECILALHTATLILVAFPMYFVAAFRKPYFMDAVLILSLLASLETLAAARYHGERKVF